MKIILTLIALVTLTPAAYAEDTGADTIAQQVQQICEHMEELAETIMKLRQRGDSVTEVMVLMEGAVSRRIVIAAYKMPIQATPEHQEELIVGFATATAIKCYEASVHMLETTITEETE